MIEKAEMTNLIVETINLVVILTLIIFLLLFSVAFLILLYRFSITRKRTSREIVLRSEYGDSILINSSQVLYYHSIVQNNITYTRIYFSNNNWNTVVETLEEIQLLLNK